MAKKPLHDERTRDEKCRRCDEQPPARYKIHCDECIADLAAWAAAVEAAKLTGETWYDLCRRMGRCTNCERKAVLGKARCKIHAAKHVARTQSRKGVRCYCCDEPPLPGRTLCQVHTDARKATYDARVAAGVCLDCGGERVHGQYCERHWHENHAKSRRAYRKARLQALHAYGGERPACACCGVTHEVFLEIDHVDDDGAAERRSFGVYNSWRFLISLRRRGFPPGYQLLCSNCNQAKHRLGYCPHKPKPAILPARLVKPPPPPTPAPTALPVAAQPRRTKIRIL